MTVGQREHRLGLGEHLGAQPVSRRHHGSTANSGGRSSRDLGRGQQLGQVLDHPVGAVVVQALGVPDPVHPDDATEATGPTGLDARERVLEDGGRAASTPRARAPARKVSGAGFPFRCCSCATVASTTASNRSAILVACRTSWVLALEETTAVRIPPARTART